MPQRRSSISIALSQHRLRTPAVASRIINSTGLAPPSLVYDWGAGSGALTAELLRRDMRVVAIERDRDEVTKLRRRFSEHRNLTTVLGDFRREQLPTDKDYSVVANLPYSLTSDAMRLLLGLPNPPRSAHLVMQREAGFRWVGVGRETEVSVLAKVRAEVDITLALHRRDFSPRPNIDSVLVRLNFRNKPLLSGVQERAFTDFVRHGFGRRRKSLLRNLGRWVSYNAFREIAGAYELDNDAAPGKLPFEGWLELFRHANGHSPSRRPRSHPRRRLRR